MMMMNRKKDKRMRDIDLLEKQKDERQKERKRKGGQEKRKWKKNGGVFV